jgi:hypothetical protein
MREKLELEIDKYYKLKCFEDLGLWKIYVYDDIGNGMSLMILLWRARYYRREIGREFAREICRDMRRGKYDFLYRLLK